jgi:hypothetical protein
MISEIGLNKYLLSEPQNYIYARSLFRVKAANIRIGSFPLFIFAALNKSAKNFVGVRKDEFCTKSY